jgi:hypothetical protein
VLDEQSRRILDLARDEADRFGHRYLGPEHVVRTPWPRCMSNRWNRQLRASVGLPAEYQGAAGPLLVALGVDLDELGDAVVAELAGAGR